MSRALPYRPEDLNALYHLLEAQFVTVVSELLGRIQLPVKKYILFGDPAPATRAANVENLETCKAELAMFEKAMSHMLMANDRSDPRRFDQYTEKYNDLVRIIGRTRYRTTKRATEAIEPVAATPADLQKRRRKFLHLGVKAFKRLFEVIPTQPKDRAGCHQLVRIMNLATDKRTHGGSLTPQVFIDNAAFYIHNTRRISTGAATAASSSSSNSGGGGGGRLPEFPPVPLSFPAVPTAAPREAETAGAAAAGRVAVAIPYSMGGGYRRTHRRRVHRRRTHRR